MNYFYFIYKQLMKLIIIFRTLIVLVTINGNIFQKEIQFYQLILVKKKLIITEIIILILQHQMNYYHLLIYLKIPIEVLKMMKHFLINYLEYMKYLLI